MVLGKCRHGCGGVDSCSGSLWVKGAWHLPHTLRGWPILKEEGCPIRAFSRRAETGERGRFKHCQTGLDIMFHNSGFTYTGAIVSLSITAFHNGNNKTFSFQNKVCVFHSVDSNSIFPLFKCSVITRHVWNVLLLLQQLLPADLSSDPRAAPLSLMILAYLSCHSVSYWHYPERRPSISQRRLMPPLLSCFMCRWGGGWGGRGGGGVKWSAIETDGRRDISKGYAASCSAIVFPEILYLFKGGGGCGCQR